MIAPLQQHPQSPFHREKPGTRPEPREGEDGFAGILAAAQPPARTPPLAGSTPVREHGPAIVAAPIEPSTQAAMLDPALAPGAEGAGPAAEVFNRDGFFGTAIADVAAPEAAGEGASPARFALTGPLLEGAVPPASGASTLSGVAPAVVASAVARPGGVAGNRLALPVAARQAAGTTSFAVASPVSNEVEIPAEPAKAIVRRAFIREPAARSAVQVVLRELEQGLHVAARTDALDEPERLRLHDEIAALLASHGLSARSVRIHAPIRSVLMQEKFK